MKRPYKLEVTSQLCLLPTALGFNLGGVRLCVSSSIFFVLFSSCVAFIFSESQVCYYVLNQCFDDTPVALSCMVNFLCLVLLLQDVITDLLQCLIGSMKIHMMTLSSLMLLLQRYRAISR